MSSTMQDYRRRTSLSSTMSPKNTTISVTHLGGINIGYQLGGPILGSKPNLILIPGFGQAGSAFINQLRDDELIKAVNLIVLEPIGQGSSRISTKTRAFTAWDSAYAMLQAMEKLSVKKAVVYGENIGGGIAVRMALYSPDRIQGIIASNSNLDLEASFGGDRNAEHLYLRVAQDRFPPLNLLVPGSTWKNTGSTKAIAETFLGKNMSPEIVNQWLSVTKAHYDEYNGEDGREMIKQAWLAMTSRDSLLHRVADIKCPVLWITATQAHGFDTEGDAVTKQIAAFQAVEVQVEVIKDAMLPWWTHAEQMRKLVVEFTRKHGGLRNADVLRQAVATIEM